MKKNKNFIFALKNALAGLIFGLRYERNIQYDFVIAFFVVLVSGYLKINKVEWFFVIFSIGLVLIVEYLNSAIERCVDLVIGSQYHKLAKQAKDAGASAALIAALASAIVGLMIFMPKLIKLL